MKKIAILIETRRGQIKSSLYGVITAAQAPGRELFALAFEADAVQYADRLKSYGIHHLVTITGPSAGFFSNPDNRARAVIRAMDHFDIHTLFALTSLAGKDLLPRIAARLDAPLVMDCLGVNLDDSTVEKPQFSGKTIATIRVTGTHHIFGIRPNMIEPKRVQVETKTISFEYRGAADDRLEVVEVRQGETGTVDLSEA
jgi:electron transfer flavoprotein alpha subunit